MIMRSDKKCEAKEEPKDSKPAFRSCLDELQKFDKKSLHPINTYYVNRALPIMYGIPFHGYVVLESTPKILHITRSDIFLPINHGPKAKFAEVFYLGQSSMHAPFRVSDKLIAAAESDRENYGERALQALQAMRGREFPSVEHFLRELLKKAFADKLTEEMIFHLAQDPFEGMSRLRKKLAEQVLGDETIETALRSELYYRSLLANLVELNCTINHEYGAVLPYNQNINFCKKDRVAFEKGDALVKPYPLINSWIIQDLYRHMLLYQNYMEQKAGIGKAFDDDNDPIHIAKLRVTQQDTQRIMNQLVQFTDIPYLSSQQANCNKAMTTFLQTAENIAAKESKREPETITAASYSSVGSWLRMPFWQPVKPLTLDQFIERLITNPQLKIQDSKLRQELADNKDRIIKAIEELPKEKQKMLFKKCLDEKTQLGQIFFIKRTGYYFQPDRSRGQLKLVADKLKALDQKPSAPQEASSTDEWFLVNDESQKFKKD
ncbi:MAG: hypothetical protein ACYCQI_05795 [Gammaproteobacteria bacterium]